MTTDESKHTGIDPQSRLDSPDGLLSKFILQEAEERFRLLASSIPQLIFRCSDDGAQLWASPQWTQFTGLKADESRGLGWLKAIHPADHDTTLSAWATACSSGVYAVQQRVWCAARSEYRWHSTSAKPVPGLTEWIGAMTEIHDLLEQRRRQDILMSELQHRARNLLGVTWAIANKTVRTSTSLDSFKREFRKRIGALSRVQELTWREDQQDVDLRELLVTELSAHSPGGIEAGKITMEGPPIALSVSSAQCLGLAIHELSTNALKYGALSRAAGKLDLKWEVETSGEATVRFIWRETGVSIPPESTPRRCGYGTELIKRALPFDLGAKTDLLFEADGLRCTIEVTRKKLGSDSSRAARSES